MPAPTPPHNRDGYLLLRATPTDPIDILAVGASTGGIHALGVLFNTLPKRIGVPILVPLVCFILSVWLMPETKHMSVWDEAKRPDAPPAEPAVAAAR